MGKISENENLEKYSLPLGIRVRKINKDHYIIGKGMYFKINQISSDIISDLGNNITVHELAKNLSGIYEVEDVKEVERDVINFIDQLLKQNVLEKR